MEPKHILIICCIIFFSLGLFAAMGPALPDLADNTSSKLAALGTVYTFMFLGSLPSQILAGSLNERFGQRPVRLVSMVLLVLGVLGITFSLELWLLLAFALIMGVGFGSVNVSLNLMIAEMFARRSVAAVNLVSVFYGAGAVLGPYIASLTLDQWETALPVLWFAAGLLTLQIPLAYMITTRSAAVRIVDEPSSLSSATIYRNPLLWMLGGLLLLYVGTEVGVGGWTTTYVDRTTSLDIDAAARVTSGFWLMLTGGRLLGAIFGSRFAAHIVLRLCLLGALVGGLLLGISTGHALLTVLALLILGLSFGPIYPTTIAITASAFRSGAGKAVSVCLGMGSIGGMLLPWLQGVLLDQWGASANVLAVATGTLMMLLIFAGVRWFSRARMQVAVEQGTQ